MKNETAFTLRRAARNWWISIPIGIIVIILGVWCIAAPIASMVGLTWVFVAGFIVSGLLEISFAISNSGTDGWGWSLAGGILDLLLGVLPATLPLPILTTMLVWFVGFWLMFRSIWSIGVASDLNRWGARGWGWLMAAAIVGVVASFMFFVSPAFGGGMVVWLAGVAFILYGIFRIGLGVKLRQIEG